jgi:DNA-directed RNA polymerase specialized sigma24 family protein
MTKKPATRIREAVQALAAIPDPTERALAAGDMTDAVREATSDVAAIRSKAIQEMRAQGLSYRAIGDKLGIHFTRVSQLEKGETTGRRKKPAADENATPEA